MERALALFLAAQLAGCSFIGVAGVPANAPPTQKCKESDAYPFADATGAVVLGLLGTLLLVADQTKPAGERFYPATVGGIAFVGLAIPLAFSAWWGFRNVTRCRMARGGPVFGTQP